MILGYGGPISLFTTVRETKVHIDEEKKEVKKTILFNYTARSETHRATRETFVYFRGLDMPGHIKLTNFTHESVEPAATLYTVTMPYGGLDLKKFTSQFSVCQWNEQELADQLDRLIDILAEVERKKRWHGQITLEHIVVDENMNMNLINFCIMGTHNDDKVQLARKMREIYLSPVRAKIKKEFEYDEALDMFKSDVWSLAICFLLVLVNRNDEVRDSILKHGPEVCFSYLEDFPELKKRLILMLEPDEAKRMNFTNLNYAVHAFRGVDWEPRKTPEPVYDDDHLPPVPGLRRPPGTRYIMRDEELWDSSSESSEEDEDEEDFIVPEIDPENPPVGLPANYQEFASTFARPPPRKKKEVPPKPEPPSASVMALDLKIPMQKAKFVYIPLSQMKPAIPALANFSVPLKPSFAAPIAAPGTDGSDVKPPSESEASDKKPGLSAVPKFSFKAAPVAVPSKVSAPPFAASAPIAPPKPAAEPLKFAFKPLMKKAGASS